MSLGHAEVVKSNYAKAVQARINKYKAAYKAAADVADQTMQNMVPERTGALKASTSAKVTEDGLGIIMRSYGDEANGKAYARWVNGGHHVALKGGGAKFVPGVPYFSQAQADARATLARRLRS